MSSNANIHLQEQYTRTKKKIIANKLQMKTYLRCSETTDEKLSNINTNNTTFFNLPRTKLPTNILKK